MDLTEKEIIYSTDERFDLIKELCHLSKNLYNASLYDVTHLINLYVSLNKHSHKTVQLEHALESKYFYDFDSDSEKLKEFISDLALAHEETKKVNKKLGEFKVEVRTTPNYYAVILEERFKTAEVEEKWKDLVTLKKDALYCAAWHMNE